MTAVDVIALVLVLLPLASGIAALVVVIRMVRALPRLTDEPVRVDRASLPRVSIVVPACNEAERIERALASMLALEYPALEIVVVDDRSTDETGAVADAIAERDPRVRVIHLETLREDWLGKLAALDAGVRLATGDFLLFMDADAELEPQALARAVSFAERDGTDFVSVVPTIGSAGPIGDPAFALGLVGVGFARPWAIRDPRSTAIAATGAFMLVRRTAFERTPGFAWLRLEVADDFGLCLMIKAHGGTAQLLSGRGAVSLVWYASFGEMLRAMQKNFFAITGRFSPPRMLLQVAVFAELALFPLAVLLPSTPAIAMAVLTIACGAYVAWTGAMVGASAWSGRPLWPAFLLPVAALATALVVVRALVVGVRLGGIAWRGVVYPTKLLRAHQRVKL